MVVSGTLRRRHEVGEALEYTAGLIVAATPARGQAVDLRQVVNGIPWVLHTQAHWSDIPAGYRTRQVPQAPGEPGCFTAP